MSTINRPDSFSIAFFDETKASRNFRKYPLRVVGYGRLSFDEDGERFCSIINQQEITEAYYESHLSNEDSSFVFYPDDNVSGYKFDREGFFSLLSDIETGKCNVVLAKDLSRIGRHNAMTQIFIEQCERVGIRVIAMDDYDSHNSSDELTLGIKTWSNERTVKDASAKVLKVVNHKKKNGTWLCAAPYGYIVEDYENHVVRIDEEAAEVVKRVFDMYLSGIGMKKISIILSEEGVPTPSMHARDLALAEGKTYKKTVGTRWAISTICKMLDDDFYIGTFRTNKYTRNGINGKDVRTSKDEQNVFEGKHEAIISVEDFQAVQHRRKKMIISNDRGTKKHDNRYRGIVRCGECNATLFAYRRPDLSPQYVCGTYFKYNKDACTRHMIKESTLDYVSMSFLKRIKEKGQGTINALDSEIRKLSNNRVKREETVEMVEGQILAAKSELQSIEMQRIRQIAKYPDREDMLNETYDGMSEEATARLVELQKKKEAMMDITSASKDAIKKLKTAMEVVDSILSSGHLTRRDIEAIFKQITVHDDGRVLVELNADISILTSGDGPLEFTETGQKQKPKPFSIAQLGANDVSSGSPSRILSVRRISLGMTTRPSSSILRTMPVALIGFFFLPTLFSTFRRRERSGVTGRI